MLCCGRGTFSLSRLTFLILRNFTFVMASADVHSNKTFSNEQDSIEDPVELMIKKTGCMDLHYKVQVELELETVHSCSGGSSIVLSAGGSFQLVWWDMYRGRDVLYPYYRVWGRVCTITPTDFFVVFQRKLYFRSFPCAVVSVSFQD